MRILLKIDREINVDLMIMLQFRTKYIFWHFLPTWKKYYYKLLNILSKDARVCTFDDWKIYLKHPKEKNTLGQRCCFSKR